MIDISNLTEVETHQLVDDLVKALEIAVNAAAHEGAWSKTAYGITPSDYDFVENLLNKYEI